MGHSDSFGLLNATLELFLLDLLLSGDNAILIALACRSLPTQQRFRAMVIGTGAAIVLRVLMTTVAGWLLRLPLLKLLGGLLLVAVAVKLLVEQQPHGGDSDHAAAADSGDLWSAVGTIIVADVVMSLDNVLGLAAASQGDMRLLALGLALSMPVLMFGSLFVNQLLQRYPVLVPAGGALLGWIAGDIAITDAWYADWVQQQSPGLLVIVPMLCAALVLLFSRLVRQHQAALAPAREALWRATALRQADLARARAALDPAPAMDTLAQVQTVTAVAAVAAVADEAATPTLPTVASVPVVANLAVPATPWPPTASGALARPVMAATATGVAVTPKAAPAAAPRPARAAPTGKLRRALRSLWAVGAATAALLLIMGNMIAQAWLPNPRPLLAYTCALEHQPVLFFNHGASTVRLSYQGISVNGTVQQDQVIDWGDYHDASTVLGLAPPIHIDYDDPTTVRVHGGSFDGVACKRVASRG